MPPQVWTFTLYLVLAAIVTGVFVWVARSTRGPAEVPLFVVGRLRFRFVILITIVLAAVLGLTLTKMPYELWANLSP